MNLKKNIVLKHVVRQSVNLTRGFRSNSRDSRVIVNSLPKSGTHLVQSILLELGYHDFEGFFATTSPMFMTVKTEDAAIRAIRGVMPGEVFCSHIFYSKRVADAVMASAMPMIFVKRDPRAVFVSELHYLTKMKKVHRYSRYLARCRSEDDVFDALLNGDSDVSFFFPNFAERVAVYENWQTSKQVLSLKFEDLMSEASFDCVKSIVQFIEAQGRGESIGSDKLSFSDEDIESVKRRLRPSASHTFTGLDPDRWRTELTEKQIERLEGVLGSVTERFGYY